MRKVRGNVKCRSHRRDSLPASFPPHMCAAGAENGENGVGATVQREWAIPSLKK